MEGDLTSLLDFSPMPSIFKFDNNISFIFLDSMAWPVNILECFQIIFLQIISELSMFSLAGENAEISMDVSLGYRDDMFSEWTEMAHERVPRKLKCTFTSPKVGHLYCWVDSVGFLAWSTTNQVIWCPIRDRIFLFSFFIIFLPWFFFFRVKERLDFPLKKVLIILFLICCLHLSCSWRTCVGSDKFDPSNTDLLKLYFCL